VLFRLRRTASVAQARDWLALLAVNGRLGMASTVVIVIAGLYLLLAAWGWGTPWILVSLGAIALMMALGLGVVTRRLKTVGQAVATAADLTPELRRRIHDPLLWAGAQVRGATALGVVFLMTAKPGLVGSLVALCVALALGAVAGATTARSAPGPARVAGSAGRVTAVERAR
ncbi:MAG TPA: DUF2269 family protein, partial [Ktedonobacterales bacterium]|nr:DUF2269 family protein [Ktedonobacterales bacterium]